jgi:S1-C subfamily serine protease
LIALARSIAVCAGLALAPVPFEPAVAVSGEGYLGVQVTTNLENAATTIDSVEARGPAEQAGVRPGDALVFIGYRPVKDRDDAIKYIRTQKPGTTVTLTVRRAGQDVVLRACLGRRPDDADPPRPRLPVVPEP